jgi:hypothetical protein
MFSITLQSAYYVSCTIILAEDTTENITEKVPRFMVFLFEWEMQMTN